MASRFGHCRLSRHAPEAHSLARGVLHHEGLEPHGRQASKIATAGAGSWALQLGLPINKALTTPWPQPKGQPPCH